MVCTWYIKWCACSCSFKRLLVKFVKCRRDVYEKVSLYKYKNIETFPNFIGTTFLFKNLFIWTFIYISKIYSFNPCFFSISLIRKKIMVCFHQMIASHWIVTSLIVVPWVFELGYEPHVASSVLVSGEENTLPATAVVVEWSAGKCCRDTKESTIFGPDVVDRDVVSRVKASVCVRHEVTVHVFWEKNKQPNEFSSCIYTANKKNPTL